jgi:hypothetical protein
VRTRVTGHTSFALLLPIRIPGLQVFFQLLFDIRTAGTENVSLSHLPAHPAAYFFHRIPHKKTA